MVYTQKCVERLQYRCYRICRVWNCHPREQCEMSDKDSWGSAIFAREGILLLWDDRGWVGLESGKNEGDLISSSTLVSYTPHTLMGVVNDLHNVLTSVGSLERSNNPRIQRLHKCGGVW